MIYTQQGVNENDSGMFVELQGFYVGRIAEDTLKH